MSEHNAAIYQRMQASAGIKSQGAGLGSPINSAALGVEGKG